MEHVVEDIQTLTSNIQRTSSQVRIFRRDFKKNLLRAVPHPTGRVQEKLVNTFVFKDWRGFDFVVFPNLNVDPSQTDEEFGSTMNNLFKYKYSVHFKNL